MIIKVMNTEDRQIWRAILWFFLWAGPVCNIVKKGFVFDSSMIRMLTISLLLTVVIYVRDQRNDYQPKTWSSGKARLAAVIASAFVLIPCLLHRASNG
jgi:hypothetical protein